VGGEGEAGEDARLKLLDNRSHCGGDRDRDRSAGCIAGNTDGSANLAEEVIVPRRAWSRPLRLEVRGKFLLAGFEPRIRHGSERRHQYMEGDKNGGDRTQALSRHGVAMPPQDCFKGLGRQGRRPGQP
jgi:hypothetical protein